MTLHARVFFAPTQAAGWRLLVGPACRRKSRRRTPSSCWSARRGSATGRCSNITRRSTEGGPRRRLSVVLVLLEGQTAPGLPFLRQLHWIVTPDPASEQSVARLIDAAAGAGSRPGELWRHTAPYRGLAAMTEADSDFFFGRDARDRRSDRGARGDARPACRCCSAIPASANRRWRRPACWRRFKRQAWPEATGADRAVAAGFRRQPALVLPHAAAGHRAAQGAGRAVPRHLAARRDRPAAGATRRAEWIERCSTARPRCATCSTRPSGATTNWASRSRRPSSSTWIRARSSTCAPRSASAAASPRCSRRGSAIRACAR